MIISEAAPAAVIDSASVSSRVRRYGTANWAEDSDRPSRSAGAQRVDALLERLATKHRVPYVSTLDLSLDYLDDDLHLTERGHDEFGRAVADRISEAVGAVE